MSVVYTDNEESLLTHDITSVKFPSDVDPGILAAVEILNYHGFKTFESCQGGEGHAFFEPTIRFEGTEFDLIRAYEVCQIYKIPVFEAKRVFRRTPLHINDNTPHVHQIGEIWDTPFNEITFLPIFSAPSWP